MPLKTVVKVGNISNLSDARYCSGMGVDMLGFQAIEGPSSFVSPRLFQEIRGWISGPRIIAEIYGISPGHDLASIRQNYVPDHYELSLREFLTFRRELDLPCLVLVESEEEIKALPEEGDIAYFICRDEAIASLLKKKAGQIPVLLSIRSADQLAKLAPSRIDGVVLNGSPEIRPGFKDYGDLSEILEQLEIY